MSQSEDFANRPTTPINSVPVHCSSTKQCTSGILHSLQTANRRMDPHQACTLQYKAGVWFMSRSADFAKTSRRSCISCFTTKQQQKNWTLGILQGARAASRRISTPSFSAHPVEGPISVLLGGPLDVLAVVVAALSAAAEAVLLARENAQQRASVRHTQPQLLVRV